MMSVTSVEGVVTLQSHAQPKNNGQHCCVKRMPQGKKQQLNMNCPVITKKKQRRI